MSPLLQVFDMPSTLRFYRDILGFEVVATSSDSDNADWVWLRRGDVDLMMNTAYEADARPAAPDLRRTDVHSDTGLFFACPSLDEAYDHLKTHGVRVEPPTTAPYGMRQLYVTDPDGYVLCFQWPADSDAGATWSTWYGNDSANLDADPSGV